MRMRKLGILLTGSLAALLTSCRQHEALIGTIGSPVDLGLSVMWADHNYGATASTETGKELTWNGKEHSKRQNKTVSHTWGKNWQTPTISQVKELMDKCSWKWKDESPKGFTVTGPNGNSIFIPYVSSGYWTSNFDPDNKPFVTYLYFNASYPDMSYTEADRVRFVRPVIKKK